MHVSHVLCVDLPPFVKLVFARASELSDVTEEGDLTPRLTFPDDLGEAGAGGKSKEFMSNLSVAASLHASRGKFVPVFYQPSFQVVRQVFFLCWKFPRRHANSHSHGNDSHPHVMPGERFLKPWMRWLRMLVLIVTWSIFTVGFLLWHTLCLRQITNVTNSCHFCSRLSGFS